MYERVFGDTLTFWMFAEELAQVTDAGKNGYSNLRTIMRTSYDLGLLFGNAFFTFFMNGLRVLRQEFGIQHFSNLDLTR